VKPGFKPTAAATGVPQKSFNGDRIHRVLLKGKECAMRSYRLVFLDRHGHVVTALSVDCMEDREAIAVAEQELAKRDLANCDLVEVWNGGRPVCVCARP
jgi:hypothetical protein